METQAQIKIHPVVVLREDIYSQLDDHDFNKFEDYTAHLHWSAEMHARNPLSLKRVVNERVRVSLNLREATGLWMAIADETNWGGPTDNMWSFISARTMDRPRDIIRYLKYAQECADGELLSAVAVDQAERQYSQWLQNEIGNEIFRILPEYKLAYSVMTRIGRGKFSLSEWTKEFNYVKGLSRKYHPSYVLRILFDFSVVGMEKNHKWFFKFKTPGISFNPRCSFIVHYGLMRGLVISSERAFARK